MHEGSRTFVDGLYFTMMTMSTVGYGDISPSSDAAIAPVSGPIQQRIQDWLEVKLPATQVDSDGDGIVDYTVPRSPPVYYFKNLFPSILLNIAIQLASAGVFVAIEGEGRGGEWRYFDAVYHCLVTATTVGYGDQTIVTQEGRLWASAHMALSVCLLGELISRISDAAQRRGEELARVEQLKRRLDRNLLANLLETAKQLRPQLHRDGKGLTELEFVLCMCLELGMVEMKSIRPFIKHFRQLDTSGDRRLALDDLDPDSDHFSPAELAQLKKTVGDNALKPQGFAMADL